MPHGDPPYFGGVGGVPNPTWQQYLDTPQRRVLDALDHIDSMLSEINERMAQSNILLAAIFDAQNLERAEKAPEPKHKKGKK